MRLVVMYDETPIGSCAHVDLDADGWGSGEVTPFPAYERVRGPFQRFNPYTTWLFVVEWSEIEAREMEAREQAAHLTLRGVDGALFPVRDISVADISALLPPLQPREGLAAQRDPNDRLMVATARRRNAVLVTADGPVLDYADHGSTYAR